MNLIQLLFTGRTVRPEELASQIAERAVAQVERRLNGVVHSMSQAEALGYVRARAAKPVRQQMQIVLASVPALSSEQVQEILVRATDRTVAQIVNGLSRPQQRRQAA
jgi:hypothetical protein